MFRTALRPASTLARQTKQSTRTFVSSVLLTKTWENESVNTLRMEAKNRGLSPKGNKSNLIIRIQEYDQVSAVQAMVQPPVSVARHASTSSGTSPGVSAAVQPNVPPPQTMTNVNLPDISQSDLEVEVDVPFVPDFWDSKEVKAAKEAQQATESPLPKMSLVAGAETHPAGGPSHNLHDEHAHHGTTMDSHIVPPLSGKTSKIDGTFWSDLIDDIGVDSKLPQNLSQVKVGDIQKAAADAQSALVDAIPQTGGRPQRTEKRNLTPGETKGVWVLLGIVLGGWTLGGVASS